MSQTKIDILKGAINPERKRKINLDGSSRELNKKILNQKKAKLNLDNLLGINRTSLLSLFTNLVDPYVLWDLEGNINMLNNAAVELFGYNLEIDTLTIKKLVYEKDWKLAVQTFISLKKEGSIKNIEIRFLTKSQEIKWVQVNESLIYDKQKNPIATQSIIRDITTQKLAEIALKKSEEKQVILEKERIEEQKKFQLIVENAGVFISEQNYKGDYTYANPTTIRELGYSLEEITKMNFMDFVEQSHKDRVQAFYQNQFTQKIPESYIELLAINKEGKEMWFGQHVNFMFNSDGRVEKIITVGKDITDKKRYSDIIDEQRAQLEIIVDNSNLGIVLTQFGKVLKTNATVRKFLGYTEDEMMGLCVKEISFVEDFQQSEVYTEKMAAGALDNFVINKRYKKKNGLVFWARTNVTAVRDSRGVEKYHLTLIEDIRLQREKTLMIEMVNDIAKAIIGKVDIFEIAWELTYNISKYLETEDCVIYLANENKEVLDQIAAYGDKLDCERSIINRLSIPIGKGVVGSVAKTGKAEIISDTSKDKRYISDLKKCYSEITVPIIAEGKVIGVIDSEHATKDFFTKEHLDSLQNIASLVAFQLKNAIYIKERMKAEKLSRELLIELEESNQELQDYAHVVSHDLKSPLRSILALTSWIKEDYSNVIDKKGMDNFRHIEDKIEKMDYLIDGILRYSSIGRKNFLEHKVDLNIVLSAITNIIYIPSHIEVLVKKKLPIIIGDPTRFQQLFQNLISNAIKFIDKADGIVEVDYIEDNTFYQFSVSDNGIGISKKYFKKVFDIFQSVSDGESTGIGLSIVKKIVTLYQGKIWIESQVNKGTTFYFTIKKQ